MSHIESEKRLGAQTAFVKDADFLIGWT